MKITTVTSNGKFGVTTIRLTERQVDAAEFTVVVDPKEVVADGTTQATATITILDKQGLPLSGKSVILSEAKDLLLQQPSPTNADGVTTAKLSTTKAGVVSYGKLTYSIPPEMTVYYNEVNQSESLPTCVVLEMGRNAKLVQQIIDSVCGKKV